MRRYAYYSERIERHVDMEQEAALFKALSDPLRVRLAALLANHGEICVCMLAEALTEPDFKISRHLGVLRSAGLVEARREGTWMYYRLAAPRSRLEAGLHACFRECLEENDVLQVDTRRLARATCR